VQRSGESPRGKAFATSAAYRDLKRQGHRVVAFASLPYPTEGSRSGNQLLEDLREVYAQAARLSRAAGKTVDAWEMVGEPDVGYCADLPDRVAAYQKAFYLGLKAGAREAQRRLSDGSYSLSGADTQNSEAVPGPFPSRGDSLSVSEANSLSLSTGNRALGAPIVLMGALALPPGPWLRRAAANGLLDYTDAYNFHFYGHAADLTGVIAAHARIAGHRDAPSDPSSALSPPPSGLPLWITECGINAVKKADFLNPERRQLQADFTVSTARQALADPRVAVFMPFILVHKGDPHALTLAPDKPFPAWTAYADFTRENPWPKRPLVRASVAANPMVLQWLPDNTTTLPHKVSGTYRFRGAAAIRGELRVYNFSDHPVQGRLHTHALQHAALEVSPPDEITIPPQAMVSVPVAFNPNRDSPPYWREDFAAAFVDAGGRESTVVFGLETAPRAEAFSPRRLAVAAVGYAPKHAFDPGDTVTSRHSRWLGVNGIQAEEPWGEAAGDSAAGVKLQVWSSMLERDPLRAKLAVAAVAGLPREGFIRLQLDRPMSREFGVCVDFVDRQGQRFTIWENFGVSYYEPKSTDVWLNLADFHPYFWGRCMADPTFRPEDVEEIQLRFYLNRVHDPRQITLTVMVPKE
jgi:hypothetical protein